MKRRAEPATHPGKHLAALMSEPGMSAMSVAELARQLKVPTNRLTGILNGKRAVTADTALRLGHWFRNGAEHWLRLQMAYELAQARKVVR